MRILQRPAVRLGAPGAAGALAAFCAAPEALPQAPAAAAAPEALEALGAGPDEAALAEVKKKKKKTPLKRTILLEREERRVASSSVVSSAAVAAEGGDGVAGRLLADVPEFIPFVSRQVETATASLDTAAGGAFVPSWCVPEGGVGAAAPGVASAGEEPGGSEDEAALIASAMERLKGSGEARGQQRKANTPKAKTPKELKAPVDELEVRHYVHQLLSDDMDEKVKFVLAELARFQDRAKETNPDRYAKGGFGKRLCVGMREARRAVTNGKAKAIICAPNLEVCSSEGGLDDCFEELIELCREHSVPVIFALSRNRIGKAIGRNIRQSAVTVLSAEGVHQEFKSVIRQTEELRRLWVMQRMMQCEGPVPLHGPRLKRGALDDLVVSDYEPSEDAGSGLDLGALGCAAEEAGKPKRTTQLRDEEVLEQERVAAERRRDLQAEREAKVKAAREVKMAERHAAEDLKRAEERAPIEEARKANKARKAAERREKAAAKKAGEAAATAALEYNALEEQREKDEAKRVLEEKEERERQAVEAERKVVEDARKKRAEKLAELARQEAERRAAEEEARLAAEAAEASDSDASSELPTGFNADMF